MGEAQAYPVEAARVKRLTVTDRDARNASTVLVQAAEEATDDWGGWPVRITCTEVDATARARITRQIPMHQPA